MDDARRVVEVQIGRPPRGDVTVAARCEFGLPLVVRTSARLEDGTPFPTLYWLCCPIAVREAGRLESSGLMAELTARLGEDESFAAAYRDAHERYRVDRDGDANGDAASAGGMPGRVKCLHALYAHERADANPVGSIVRERIEPLPCPGPCVTAAADGKPRRVDGHPGFKGRRR
ncbi:MAG: DUF501 domain-containing protein [Actinomycetota bacterium]